MQSLDNFKKIINALLQKKELFPADNIVEFGIYNRDDYAFITDKYLQHIDNGNLAVFFSMDLFLMQLRSHSSGYAGIKINPQISDITSSELLEICYESLYKRFETTLTYQVNNSKRKRIEQLQKEIIESGIKEELSHYGIEN